MYACGRFTLSLNRRSASPAITDTDTDTATAAAADSKPRESPDNNNEPLPRALESVLDKTADAVMELRPTRLSSEMRSRLLQRVSEKQPGKTVKHRPSLSVCLGV